MEYRQAESEEAMRQRVTLMALQSLLDQGTWAIPKAGGPWKAALRCVALADSFVSALELTPVDVAHQLKPITAEDDNE